MIDVKDLTKTYGDHQVLKGINEHISKGEKVAIIGPSGSGKSTFLRCLNLLEEPTSGTITFEGVDITNPKNDINKLRARMGMVFQQFNLDVYKRQLQPPALIVLRRRKEVMHHLLQNRYPAAAFRPGGSGRAARPGARKAS